MQLSSDITLIHPLWDRVDNELCNNSGLGIFNRIVDVYLIACAIGIKEDEVIVDSDIEAPLSTPKTIGRNTHRENQDVRNIIEFMLQNALIHSKTIDISEDERLKLAFDPDYYNKNIKASDFLTAFANYGIVKIFEKISSHSSLVAVADLYGFFESISDSQYDELLKTYTLDSSDFD